MTVPGGTSPAGMSFEPGKKRNPADTRHIRLSPGISRMRGRLCRRALKTGGSLYFTSKENTRIGSVLQPVSSTSRTAVA